ncbi:hypothetical protein OS493_034632 [Desmophyllum pertusum]|uniref:MANSC domain-containing protein n=1 Tax=Desmophyllum pertusum TaxID=174260 RepID=A0A9W9ZIP1_9CNID|nr:hypothetical protein OS493_034632 [Desmophyllum pertusum]
MQACIKKCCANHECDLAFMVKEDCYSVICYHKSLCRSVRAQHIRKYKPRIAHIWRGSNEEKERVTSNVNSRTTSRVHIKSKGKGKLALVNHKDEESVTGNAKSRTTSRKHKKSTGKSKLASVYHPEQERVTGNAKSLTTSRKHMKSTVKSKLASVAHSEQESVTGNAKSRPVSHRHTKKTRKNKTTRAHHYKERVPEKHTSSKGVGSQISSSLSSTHSSIDENSRLNASFEERMTQKKYQKSSQASSERSATKDLATPVKSSENDSQVVMKDRKKPANSTRQIHSLGSQEAKTAVHKDGFSENSPGLDNNHSACPHSAIEHNVGLRRGLKTGKFSYIGEMFDIEKCLQVCCRDVDCDIAFMLDQSCYTVNCTNKSMCHSVPYHQHQYSTKAVYVVRRFNKPKSRIGGIQRAANLTRSSKTTVSSKKGVAESSVVIGTAAHGKENLDLRHSRKQGPTVAQATNVKAYHSVSSIMQNSDMQNSSELWKEEKIKINLNGAIHSTHNNKQSDFGEVRSNKSGKEEWQSEEIKVHLSNDVNLKSLSSSLHEKSNFTLAHSDQVIPADNQVGTRHNVPERESMQNVSVPSYTYAKMHRKKIESTNPGMENRGDRKVLSSKEPAVYQNASLKIKVHLSSKDYLLQGEPDYYKPLTPTNQSSDPNARNNSESFEERDEYSGRAEPGMSGSAEVEIGNEYDSGSSQYETGSNQYETGSSLYKAGSPLNLSYPESNEAVEDYTSQGSAELNSVDSVNANSQNCSSYTYYDVTLRGGLRAGNFTFVGRVSSQEDCVTRCCLTEGCDVTFMVFDRCFLVDCYVEDLCDVTAARNADKYKPVITYVNQTIIKRLVAKSFGNSSLASMAETADDSSFNQTSNEQGNVNVMFRKTRIEQVTHGQQAGLFTNHGAAKNIHECAQRCCQSNHCDVAFMISEDCFFVRCHSNKSCGTFTIRGSKFNPRMIFVKKHRVQLENGTRNTSNGVLANSSNSSPWISDIPSTVSLDPITKSSDYYGPLSSSAALSAPATDKPLTSDELQHDLISTKASVLNVKASIASVTSEDGSGADAKQRVPEEDPSNFVEVKTNGSEFWWQYYTPKDIHLRNSSFKVKLPDVDNETGNSTTIVSNISSPQSHSHNQHKQGLCRGAKIEDGVTLAGGYYAGIFTRQDNVTSMKECVSSCCRLSKCNVAFMVTKICYSVQCFSKEKCIRIKAHYTSRYHPLVSYVRQSSDVTNHVTDHNVITDKLRCVLDDVSEPKYQVDDGSVLVHSAAQDLGDCAKLCCQTKGCEVALQDNGTCYSLNCHGNLTCPNTNLSRDALSSSRSLVVIKDFMQSETRSERVFAEACDFSNVLNEVVLRGGSQSGKFKYLTEVEDMNTCIRECCRHKVCDLALMLKDNCFLVSCHNEMLCDPIQSRTSDYHPQIAYKIKHGKRRNIEIRPRRDKKNSVPARHIPGAARESNTENATFTMGRFFPVSSVKVKSIHSNGSGFVDIANNSKADEEMTSNDTVLVSNETETDIFANETTPQYVLMSQPLLTLNDSRSVLGGTSTLVHLESNLSVTKMVLVSGAVESTKAQSLTTVVRTVVVDTSELASLTMESMEKLKPLEVSSTHASRTAESVTEPSEITSLQLQSETSEPPTAALQTSELIQKSSVQASPVAISDLPPTFAIQRSNKGTGDVLAETRVAKSLNLQSQTLTLLETPSTVTIRDPKQVQTSQIPASPLVISGFPSSIMLSSNTRLETPRVTEEKSLASQNELGIHSPVSSSLPVNKPDITSSSSEGATVGNSSKSAQIPQTISVMSKILQTDGSSSNVLRPDEQQNKEDLSSEISGQSMSTTHVTLGSLSSIPGVDAPTSALPWRTINSSSLKPLYSLDTPTSVPALTENHVKSLSLVPESEQDLTHSSGKTISVREDLVVPSFALSTRAIATSGISNSKPTTSSVIIETNTTVPGTSTVTVILQSGKPSGSANLRDTTNLTLQTSENIYSRSVLSEELNQSHNVYQWRTFSVVPPTPSATARVITEASVTIKSSTSSENTPSSGFSRMQEERDEIPVITPRLIGLPSLSDVSPSKSHPSTSFVDSKRLSLLHKNKVKSNDNFISSKTFVTMALSTPISVQRESQPASTETSVAVALSSPTPTQSEPESATTEKFDTMALSPRPAQSESHSASTETFIAMALSSPTPTQSEPQVATTEHFVTMALSSPRPAQSESHPANTETIVTMALPSPRPAQSESQSASTTTTSSSVAQSESQPTATEKFVTMALSSPAPAQSESQATPKEKFVDMTLSSPAPVRNESQAMFHVQSSGVADGSIMDTGSSKIASLILSSNNIPESDVKETVSLSTQQTSLLAPSNSWQFSSTTLASSTQQGIVASMEGMSTSTFKPFKQEKYVVEPATTEKNITQASPPGGVDVGSTTNSPQGIAAELSYLDKRPLEPTSNNVLQNQSITITTTSTSVAHRQDITIPSLLDLPIQTQLSTDDHISTSSPLNSVGSLQSRASEEISSSEVSLNQRKARVESLTSIDASLVSSQQPKTSLAGSSGEIISAFYSRKKEEMSLSPTRPVNLNTSSEEFGSVLVSFGSSITHNSIAVSAPIHSQTFEEDRKSSNTMLEAGKTNTPQLGKRVNATRENEARVLLGTPFPSYSVKTVNSSTSISANLGGIKPSPRRQNTSVTFTSTSVPETLEETLGKFQQKENVVRTLASGIVASPVFHHAMRHIGELLKNQTGLVHSVSRLENMLGHLQGLLVRETRNHLRNSSNLSLPLAETVRKGKSSDEVSKQVDSKLDGISSKLKRISSVLTKLQIKGKERNNTVTTRSNIEQPGNFTRVDEKHNKLIELLLKRFNKLETLIQRKRDSITVSISQTKSIVFNGSTTTNYRVIQHSSLEGTSSMIQSEPKALHFSSVIVPSPNAVITRSFSSVATQRGQISTNALLGSKGFIRNSTSIKSSLPSTLYKAEHNGPHTTTTGPKLDLLGTRLINSSSVNNNSSIRSSTSIISSPLSKQLITPSSNVALPTEATRINKTVSSSVRAIPSMFPKAQNNTNASSAVMTPSLTTSKVITASSVIGAPQSVNHRNGHNKTHHVERSEEFTYVTFRSGLEAGVFTDRGKVKTMESCVQRCYNHSSCHVAFMVGHTCYSIHCYSQKTCEVLPVQTPIISTRVVYLKDRMLQLPYSTTTQHEASSLVTDDKNFTIKNCAKNITVLKNMTFLAGMSAGNYTDYGTVDSIQACSNICCSKKVCDAAFMILNNCFTIDCISDKACHAIPSRSHKVNTSIVYFRKTLSTKRFQKVVMGVPKFKNPQLCPLLGGVLKGVTFNGGMNAGNFTDHGFVNEFSSCITKCCSSKTCDVAFMVEKNCYSVKCAEDKRRCLPIIARSTKFKTLMAVKKTDHFPNFTIPTANNSRCAQRGPTQHNFTFRKGIKAGNFTERGKVKNMGICIQQCCRSSSCSAAFMIGKTCYSVLCPSKKDCDTVLAKKANFTTAIAFVNRTQRGRDKAGKTKSNQRHTFTKSILGGHCDVTDVQHNVNITGGWKAGKFLRIPDIKDMKKCIEACCDYHRCGAAMFIDQFCYNLICFKQRGCQLIGSKEAFMIDKFVAVRKNLAHVMSPFKKAQIAALTASKEHVNHSLFMHDVRNANKVRKPINGFEVGDTREDKKCRYGADPVSHL